MSGTSMATPLVAGGASLIWQYAPYLTYAEVKDVLMKTSDPVVGGGCGSGRLNLGKAMRVFG